MADERISVMHSWFETWNRGDLDSFSALYALDAEMLPPPGWVESGVVSGRAAIRQFFEGLKQAWDGEDKAELHELSHHGELLVSRMSWQVRGRASGIETQLPITSVNAIAGGAIVRQWHYLDHADALGALASLESER
ncbi:MAG: nuclear transport factor 2 family protein [Solirubrobacteraceae bacterium]